MGLQIGPFAQLIEAVCSLLPATEGQEIWGHGTAQRSWRATHEKLTAGGNHLEQLLRWHMEPSDWLNSVVQLASEGSVSGSRLRRAERELENVLPCRPP